jgi:hypothetical protein
MSGDGNGAVSISRITIPLLLVGGIIVGSIVAAVVHIGTLQRIDMLEAWREGVEGKRAFRRRDMYEWVLHTQAINPGWSGHNPYDLPSDDDKPYPKVSSLAGLPPIWSGVKR